MRKTATAIALALIASSLTAAPPDQEKVRERAAATLVQMQTIDTAIGAYISDYNAPPKATTMVELAKALSPTYILELPLADAWGTPFRYEVDGNTYRVISAGADRKFGPAVTTPRPEGSNDPSEDAVISNGSWIVTWALGGETAQRAADVQQEVQHQKAILDSLPEAERSAYFWRWSTLQQMDEVAAALEKYAKEKKHYPKAATMAELKSILYPDYIADMQTNDHWGTPFRYSVSADGASYTLACAGSDKTFRPDSWSKGGEFDSDAEDVVVRDGKRVRGWKLPK